MNDQLAAMKQGARMAWAAGKFDDLSKLILPVGEEVVAATGVSGSDAVLDVACGTGNAAIPAARTGATVTGLDITPELLQDAAANADAAGVALTLIEGDAEDLPFEDETFDVVVSTFGCMFAPRHEVAAAEIARVLKPGGRIGICAWTPTGNIGEFFQMIGSHMPPPPPGLTSGPPIMWGDEGHVRGLFADSGIDLSFSEEIAHFEFPSLDYTVDFYVTKFGPIVMAKAALEPQGKWEPMLADLTALYDKHNEGTDNVILRNQYLRTTGTKAG